MQQVFELHRNTIFDDIQYKCMISIWLSVTYLFMFLLVFAKLLIRKTLLNGRKVLGFITLH